MLAIATAVFGGMYICDFITDQQEMICSDKPMQQMRLSSCSVIREGCSEQQVYTE